MYSFYCDQSTTHSSYSLIEDYFPNDLEHFQDIKEHFQFDKTNPKRMSILFFQSLLMKEKRPITRDPFSNNLTLHTYSLS